MARSEEFDVAILDVNLAGEMSFPVAEALKARAIPVILASGYSSSSLPKEYRDLPHLQKPYPIHKLNRAINVALKNPFSEPPAYTPHTGGSLLLRGRKYKA